MKKIYKYLFFISLIIILGIYFSQEVKLAKAFTSQNKFVPMSNMKAATDEAAKAMPLVFYLSTTTAGTATSTFPLYATSTQNIAYFNDGDDQNTIFLSYIGSTTAGQLDWQYQFSNDEVTWYSEDMISSSYTATLGTFAHASTTVVHTWKPGVSATTSKVFNLPNIPAKFKRLILYPDPSTTSGAIQITGINKVIVAN